jgi:hypothetical protein
VRSDSQENNGFIGKVLTKTVFALGDITTFFTDHKNNAEVTINTSASTANQVQLPTGITQRFCVVVWVVYEAINPAFNPLTQ